MTQQKEMLLPAFSRGFHIITGLVLQHMPDLPETGLMHIFIRHTSAALAINENYDHTVLSDLENAFSRLAPEGRGIYAHSLEGPDDMPAHIKSILAGTSVCIPITGKRLNLGTWQGIYLCEFRNEPQRRTIVITVTG